MLTYLPSERLTERQTGYYLNTRWGRYFHEDLFPRFLVLWQGIAEIYPRGIIWHNLRYRTSFYVRVLCNRRYTPQLQSTGNDNHYPCFIRHYPCIADIWSWILRKNVCIYDLTFHSIICYIYIYLYTKFCTNQTNRNNIRASSFFWFTFLPSEMHGYSNEHG